MTIRDHVCMVTSMKHGIQAALLAAHGITPEAPYAVHPAIPAPVEGVPPDLQAGGPLDPARVVLGTDAERDLLDFGEALDMLRKGATLTRSAWVGRMGLTLTSPVGAFTQRLFVLVFSDGVVPWYPTDTDLLALDWAVVA